MTRDELVKWVADFLYTRGVGSLRGGQSTARALVDKMIEEKIVMVKKND